MVTLTTTFGNLNRTVARIVSKHKPAVADFNYNNRSRNCYNNNRIRVLSRNEEIVSSTITRTIAAIVSKQKPRSAALNYNIQSRNCYNNDRIRMLSGSKEMVSSTITRTLAAVVCKQKPTLAAYNYSFQSPNCYNINHIRMLSHSKEIVCSAITRDKTEASIENTSNKTVMDDYGSSKTDGIEVFVKALEREGVTDIFYFMLNKYVRDLTVAVSRSKAIDLDGNIIETFTYYTATGFANADQGHRDRPGVCCISADSALIINEVLVRCGGRGPVVFILVPFDKDNETYSLRFNNDACMSLPHYFRVLDVREITTTVQQAFSCAYNEPGGPVFIDIQRLLLDHVDYEEDMRTEAKIVVDYLGEFCPSVILYVSSSLDDGVEQQKKKELSRFLELTGIQVTHSLVGLEDAVLVLYVGATIDDLLEIVTVNEHRIVLLIDVGDEEEMQKFIKPRGQLTTFPTFKEINEILVAEGIRFHDDFSCWGRFFLEIQRQRENVLASCYADITSAGTANNDKRITQEFATRVLDEFFEDNKEKVMVYRGDNDQWFLKYGADNARPEKDVYVVIDGFEKGILNSHCCECVIILDNSGWTKRFYQETRKLFIENFKTMREFNFNGLSSSSDDDPSDDDLSWGDDDLFEERVVGKVVTDKCDLKNVLYQYHESPARYKTWLVVAVVPPADRFIEEEIPNFGRDLRFFNYPSAYLWKLVDRSPPTD